MEIKHQTLATLPQLEYCSDCSLNNQGRMKLSHYFKNNLCVVSLEGNIAWGEVKEVDQYVTPLLENEQSKGMILNLKKVKFIDSNGLGLVINIYKSLQKQQAPLALCYLNSEYREFFQWAKLDESISICHTEQEALVALQQF